MDFSVLILTQNEELHLRACLASLEGVQRVVIIDSGSTDRTLAIAREDPRVELHSRAFTSFSEQRNHGLRECFAPHDWVLHLDADERLTDELAREIENLPNDRATAYNIAPMTFLRGRAIPRASGFPVYQTRLTRGDFRFVEVGHGQKAPREAGRFPRLRQWYEHHPFEKGMREWLARHQRYARKEAAARRSESAIAISDALRDPIARRQWLKQMSYRVPGRPWLIYTYMMYIQGGTREGKAGWIYCRLRCLYEKMIDEEFRRAR